VGVDESRGLVEIMCGVDAFGSLASAGFGVLGKIGEHNAQTQAVKENNQKVLQNLVNANTAASSMYGDLGRRFNYESRANQLEANAATMAGRASIGTGLASAGSSGFNGNSLTVGAVIADEERRIAENEENYAIKQDDLRSAYNSEGKRVQAQAQDRINSMSFQSAPSGSLLGLNIANTVGDVADRYLKKRNEREYQGVG
jgi:hypothetical protein